MTTPKALALEIVTPDRPIVHEDVDEVQLPGWDGALGILPGHTPLLAMLRPGELWYRKGSERSYVVLDFGMAEVLPDRVTVMVRLADRPLMNSRWELVLNTLDEPANFDINLNDITDIRFFIYYNDFTVY